MESNRGKYPASATKLCIYKYSSVLSCAHEYTLTGTHIFTQTYMHRHTYRYLCLDVLKYLNEKMYFKHNFIDIIQMIVTAVVKTQLLVLSETHTLTFNNSVNA